MSTDRELLELAMKAYADPNIIKGMHPDFTRWIGRNEDLGCDVFVNFNPLTDDGDNRRLQITLKASLAWDSERNGWEAMINGGEDNQLFFTDPDPKRAMVLLAAAIAEQGE